MRFPLVPLFTTLLSLILTSLVDARCGYSGMPPSEVLDELRPLVKTQMYAFDNHSTAALHTSRPGAFNLGNSWAAQSSQQRRTVQVVVHLIGQDTSASKLEAQFKVLNQDYAAAGFTFVHKATTQTHDKPEWATNAGQSRKDLVQAASKALHQGGLETLNLYIVDALDGDSTLGTTFPFTLPRLENPKVVDGVWIVHSSLPGSGDVHFGRGRTATHEIGHWLGLWHTFEGGCEDRDDIADTPAEAEPARGCPKGRDTCTSQPGKDDVTNFMNYSDDTCMDHFTPGQMAFMRAFATKRGL